MVLATVSTDLPQPDRKSSTIAIRASCRVVFAIGIDDVDDHVVGRVA